MLQQDRPDDFVIATGETHSVKEFVERAFSLVDLDWRDFVVVDETFFRPAEIHILAGDCRKARKNCIGKPRPASSSLWTRWCGRISRGCNSGADL